MDIYSRIRENIHRNRYDIIGSGSGRIVYDLGNGYVVKKAMNRKGIAQNEMEYRISSEFAYPIITKVVGFSNDSIYLIAQKAEKLLNESYLLNYYGFRSFQELINSFEIQMLLRRYGVVPHDLWYVSSWGVVNGVPVIVDYGFTAEIRRKYYWGEA